MNLLPFIFNVMLLPFFFKKKGQVLILGKIPFSSLQDRSTFPAKLYFKTEFHPPYFFHPYTNSVSS